MHELLVGKRPFHASTRERLAKRVRKRHVDFEADHWEEISIEALDLVEKLLVKDPAERLDAASLLKESWL